MAGLRGLFPSMEGKLPIQVVAIQVNKLLIESEKKIPIELAEPFRWLVNANNNFTQQANLEAKRKAGAGISINSTMRSREDKLEDEVKIQDQGTIAINLTYEQKRQALEAKVDSLNQKIVEARNEQDDDRFRQLVLDNKHNLDVAQQFDETERMLNAASCCWRFFHCCAPKQYLDLKEQFEQRREQFAKLLQDKESTRELVVASIIKDRDAANVALQSHLANRPALQLESKERNQLAKLDGRMELAEEEVADDLKPDTLIAFLRVYEGLSYFSEKLEPAPTEASPLLPKIAGIFDPVIRDFATVIRTLTPKLDDFYCSELSDLTALHFHNDFLKLALNEQNDFIAVRESQTVKNKLLFGNFSTIAPMSIAANI